MARFVFVFLVFLLPFCSGLSLFSSGEECETPSDEKFGGFFSTREGKWGDTEFFEQEMIRFMLRQEEIMKNPETAKIIGFLPVHTGLGNRLEGMVSAFLIAYLTDRAFLVDFDYYDPKTRLARIKMVEDAILDEPFPWSSSLLVQDIPSEHFEENKVEMELRGGKTTYEEPFTEVMTCGDMAEYLDGLGQYVLIKGNKYFAQLIANNPHYSEKISQLFGGGVHRNMFAPLAGFLIRPKLDILQEVQSFLGQYEGKRILGVQMRTTEKYAVDAHVPIYPECADLHAYDDETLIFLATDDVGARGYMHKRFGDRLIFHSDLINMKARHGRYRTDVRHGLKDILTLALVDDLVVTCGSSFSRVAIGLGRTPAVVASAGEMYCKNHVPRTCSRISSLEPCCFNWVEYSFRKATCFTKEMDYQEMALCTNM